MRVMSPSYASNRSPSTLHLPRGNWTTVLDCLCEHFSHVSREVWLDRMARERVLDGEGRAVEPHTPYREGLAIRYFREMPAEIPVPFTETVLHADDNLVVVDKPHFLSVIPTGRYVEQTLLARLIARLGNPQLSPLHRIDRSTAGLVMFSANRSNRAQYQRLFRERSISKQYQAIAPPLPHLAFPFVYRSRLEKGVPFYLMREAEGEPNSETRIDVLERGEQYWRYALTPVSGKQHQLRVHMAALGAGIVNDDFYPVLNKQADDDFTRPLQLLAAALAFVDPLTGEHRQFTSRLQLQAVVPAAPGLP